MVVSNNRVYFQYTEANLYQTLSMFLLLPQRYFTNNCRQSIKIHQAVANRPMMRYPHRATPQSPDESTHYSS